MNLGKVDNLHLLCRSELHLSVKVDCPASEETGLSLLANPMSVGGDGCQFYLRYNIITPFYS